MAQAGNGVKRRRLTDEELTAEFDRRYKAIMRGDWQVRKGSFTEVETKEDPHFLVLNTGMYSSGDERVRNMNVRVALHVVYIHNKFIAEMRRGDI